MCRFSLVLVSIIALVETSAAFAAGIREFDLKTVEKLGREMNHISQRADKGATTELRERARQTGIDAVKDRLFDSRNEYLIVDDPDGSAFLVYAMPVASPSNIVVDGNYRVTISADGTKAERRGSNPHAIAKSTFCPAP